jgi:hypothetical protein
MDPYLPSFRKVVPNPDAAANSQPPRDAGGLLTLGITAADINNMWHAKQAAISIQAHADKLKHCLPPWLKLVKDKIEARIRDASVTKRPIPTVAILAEEFERLIPAIVPTGLRCFEESDFAGLQAFAQNGTGITLNHEQCHLEHCGCNDDDEGCTSFVSAKWQWVPQ